MAKKRWVKKGAKKTKGWKKTGKKRKMPKYEATLYRKEFQFSAFPPRLKTKLRCYTDTLTGEGNAIGYWRFRLNGFGDGPSNTNGCGPSAAFGAYGKNYPTGLKYLLSGRSSGAGAPATSPYSYYVVTGARFKFRYTPYGVEVNGHAASNFSTFAYFPVAGDTTPYTAVGFATLLEQPGVHSFTINTPDQTGAGGASNTILASANQTGSWRHMRVDISKYLGVSRKTLRENTLYWGNYNTDVLAAQKCDAFITFSPDNPGTTYQTGMIEAEIEYDVEFFGRNIMSSIQVVQ